jgi:hypothetical protein
MIMASCETANCSWPVVPTLAACGECTTVPVTYRCNQTSEMCTYSTPSGTSVDNGFNSGEHSSFRVSPSNGTVHPIDSDDRAYFGVFDLVSVTQTSSRIPIVAGSECAMWFCINSYHISISDGSQNETLLANWSNTTTVYGSSESSGSEYVFVGMPQEMNLDNETRYTVSHDAMTALRNFMTSITSGTVYADESTMQSSSDWVEAMHNATDSLADWISTFVQSMTVEIRQHGTVTGQGKKSYDGSALQLAPFMKVQWFWMVYPGVLVLLGLFYLVRTMVASAHDRVSAWKSDALPMLFCQIDARIHDRVQDGMDMPDGLVERVGQTAVALYQGENGQWMFRATDEDE